MCNCKGLDELSGGDVVKGLIHTGIGGPNHACQFEMEEMTALDVFDNSIVYRSMSEPSDASDPKEMTTLDVFEKELNLTCRSSL